MDKLKAVSNYVSTHKDVIIKRSLIVGGTVVGLLVANSVLTKLSGPSSVTNVEGDLVIETPTTDPIV